MTRTRQSAVPSVGSVWAAVMWSGLMMAGLAATGCSELGLDDPSSSTIVPPPVSASTSTTTTTPEPARQNYEVERGDTLISIAAKFGLDLNRLVRANNIVDPKLIFVGQVLVIPPPANQTDKPLLTIAPATNPVLPSVLPTLAPSTTAIWK